jgi:hypothetical protein
MSDKRMLRRNKSKTMSNINISYSNVSLFDRFYIS